MSILKSLLLGSIVSLSAIGVTRGNELQSTPRSSALEKPPAPSANSPKSGLTVAPPWWFADGRLSFEHNAHGVTRLHYFAPTVADNNPVLLYERLWEGLRVLMRVSGESYAPDFLRACVTPWSISAPVPTPAGTLSYRAMAVKDALVFEVTAPPADAAPVTARFAAATWAGNETRSADSVPSTGGPVPFRTNGVAPAKRWFDGAGLGLFVHWGIASVHGRAELSWSMMKDGPYRKDLALVKPRDYFALAERFRPDRYDPDRWLAAAAAAGFRYAVFTTKHHEGFALWPSAYGDFNTRKHLAGRDFVGEFVSACRRHGLRVGLYYSMPDWYFHRDYMSFSSAGDGLLLDQDHHVVKTLLPQPAGMADAFRAYERGQIEELLTRYGRIDLFWPDGSSPGIISEERLRELQPDMILGPRMLGTGDYRISAECSFPTYRPQEWWELCEMWNAGGWGYVTPGDYYPTRWMLDRFVHTRSWGGNYLINCAPDASGDMPPKYYERMQELRTWMTTAGEAVFGTTPGLYPERSGVPVTVRGEARYAFLLPPDSECLRDHTLHDVPRPTEACLLRTGESVPFDYDEAKCELRFRPGTNLFTLGLNEPVRIIFPRPEPVASGASGWVRLFNGHDLTGWRQHRFAHNPRWEVKEQVLVSSGGQGYLATAAEYADFELFAEVRIRDTEGVRGGKSGIYIRCQPHRDVTQEYPSGYEVQCDHGDEKNPTGSIYNLGVPGARAPLPHAKHNEWFTLRILAQGDHLRTWVNGEPGADCQLPQGGFTKGYVLLQQHHRTGIVEFRQIRIRTL